MHGRRWLNVAAVGSWLFCGLPQLIDIATGQLTGWPAAASLTAFVLYGAALLLVLYDAKGIPSDHGFKLLLVAVQSIGGIVFFALSAIFGGQSGATFALLVIVAAELPHLVSGRVAAAWIAVQTVVTMTILLRSIENVSWANAIAIGTAVGGFQLFAAASSYLASSEAMAREKLAAVNAELLATRALLAENSRATERLRISRDLHDTLGHHLTALSLQLDVAARLSDGKPADHIRQAHAITRLLLGDVRDVVSSLRDTSRIDLAQAIRALAIEQTGVAIHLDLPPTLGVDDGARAEALLRCVQEIITNTTRHAQARNLWIRLESRADGITLHARDDGHGADAVSWGNGLTGMRERFAEYAGHVEFEAGRGSGFEVRGFMPIPAAV